MLTRLAWPRLYHESALTRIRARCPPLGLVTRQLSSHRHTYGAERGRPNRRPPPPIDGSLRTGDSWPSPRRSYGNRDSTQVQVTFTKSDLQTELRWLHDPFDLAEKTRSRLKTGNDEEQAKALELVRLASAGMKCTVSWNHLINHKMLDHDVGEAIKLYNEMKKRAQLPDAYTFTLLFRGLAHNIEHPGSLQKALALYTSMRADNSPVRPNLTHTNAVLNICGLKKDIDAMLGIAADLPTKGKDAPDKTTFTTILNALRHAADKRIYYTLQNNMGEVAKRDIQNEVTLQGRRLWEEIRDRWSKLDFEMDEQLVCAMGRLLMFGQSLQNHDDIFSLLSQTMQIPRQIPPLGDQARRNVENEQQSADNNTSVRDDHRNPMNRPLERENITFSGISPRDEAKMKMDETNPFEPVKLSPHQYVKPGNKTLSLALDVCADLELFRVAQDYWGLLTDPKMYNIVPDMQNYVSYLRLLRFRRQSRMTLNIVREMKAGTLSLSSSSNETQIPMKVFRIALSTCDRDRYNPNCLDTAKELVTMMTQSHEYADPKALQSFLTVALSVDGYEAPFHAAHICLPMFRSLRGRLADMVTSRARGTATRATADELEEELKGLATKLIKTIDLTVERGLEVMNKKERAFCQENRALIMAWISKVQERKQVTAKRNREYRQLKEVEVAEKEKVEKEREVQTEKELMERDPQEGMRRKWLIRKEVWDAPGRRNAKFTRV